MAQQCAQHRAQETQRNTQNAGILQREPSLCLNQVARRAGDGWRINGHQAGAHENKANRSNEANSQARNRASCVEAAPKNGKDNDRQIGGSSHGERQRHQKSYIGSGAEHNGDSDSHSTDHERGEARDANLLAWLALYTVVNHIRPEVVRERGGGADGESCDDRENSGKGDGADESEEDVPGERLREKWGAHVGATMRADEVAANNGGSAEPEEGSHDVEAADECHGPNDAVACGFGVGNSVEAHKNVRESRSTENKREAQ